MNDKEKQEDWEKDFDEIFYMTGKPLRTLYVRDWLLPADSVDIKDFIKKLLLSEIEKAREKSYAEGYTRGQKDAFGVDRERVKEEGRREERAMCRKIYIDGADWAEWGISDEGAGVEFDKAVEVALKEK